MSETKHNVPAFSTVDELRGALETKGKCTEYDLYPRDGTRQLVELESAFATLVRVEPEDVVLCSSGMAAVVNTLEACVTPDGTVACAWQTYSQTGQYVREHLAQRGIKVAWFDSGSPEEVARVIQRCKPDVIFSETVSNGPDVPVLDTNALLAACKTAEIEPYILLDNTLPLSTGYDISNYLDDNHNIIGIESATKSYAFNAELAGIVYSKNEELICKLRAHRTTKGFGPNLGALDTIEAVIPRSLAEFDARNSRIFKSSLALATTLHQVLAPSGNFYVSHPSLPIHPNIELANQILTDGSAPVFYVQCLGETDQFELTRQLWDSPDIRAQCELGQSFGFDTTRILPNPTYPAVRIAAGAQTDVATLQNAIATLADKSSSSQ